MVRRLRRVQRRHVTCVLVASALAMVSCSPEAEPNGESGAASELEFELDGASSLLEGGQTDDPDQRARIELMTRDATESVVHAARFLADQSGFRVVADVSFDVLQSDGRLLEFGASRDITIRRPNRVRMKVVRRDGEVRTLYFDGSAISIDLPGHGAFVREELPGTLYAALEHLSEELGVPVPLGNLFSENFAAPLEDQIVAGYFVGSAEIGGRHCEHFAFRLPEVDVQLWIEEGDRPLVARIVITHKRDDGNPQFRATLRDWDLVADTPETLFQFEPAEGSEQLVVGSFLGRQTTGETGGEKME
jgi:hypothetical protein